MFVVTDSYAHKLQVDPISWPFCQISMNSDRGYTNSRHSCTCATDSGSPACGDCESRHISRVSQGRHLQSICAPCAAFVGAAARIRQRVRAGRQQQPGVGASCRAWFTTAIPTVGEAPPRAWRGAAMYSPAAYEMATNCQVARAWWRVARSLAQPPPDRRQPDSRRRCVAAR